LILSNDTIIMSAARPPYEITGSILQKIISISEKLGEVKAARLTRPTAELRKQNRIKTIQSSLEIEGNTMSVSQVTDLLNGKRVIGPKKDILEVRNAIEVYSRLDEFNVYSLNSLCKAHKFLMKGLLPDNGKLRLSAGGIVKGSEVAHLAPPGDLVFPLMKDLFLYLESHEDVYLIKSCVFHYELEFIHPFSDGNGRIGRLWQTMILRKVSPVFEFLPIETLIKGKQQEYYDVLGQADREGSSTRFIEFMLGILEMELEEILETQNIVVSSRDRIQLFRLIIGTDDFSRQDYLRHNKEISQATASRDLKEAVVDEILEKKGDKRLTRYRFNQ
jgi:Fic family protein